jgi:hypothetical protein
MQKPGAHQGAAIGSASFSDTPARFLMQRVLPLLFLVFAAAIAPALLAESAT